MCRNERTTPVSVTLHIDLSEDGRRSSFDDMPWGGMPLRDFLFLQAPGQSWQQVDGTTSGWVVTVRFSAQPGDTKVGLSPWYNYGDYLNFVHGLKDHPHLAKERIGLSNQGASTGNSGLPTRRSVSNTSG